ncbi:Transient receptor potential cation channel subfamily M member 2 [Schistosoma japonicum]|nr:Transient receptor potential cation channel subfamily M member 2 [Schistosoma japonicum]
MQNRWPVFSLITVCYEKYNAIYPELCVCNTPLADHQEITKNPQLRKVLNTSKMQYYELPTRTFGDIAIPVSTYSPNFIRVSDQTDPEHMMTIFTKIWKLSRPQLILCFYGDYTDSAAIREKIRRLIWKVSESTKTWVITDGVKSGLSVVASGAVKDFIQAYGEGQVEAIGIVPWKFIADNCVFVPSDYSGLSSASFPTCTKDTNRHFALDTNLTQYIFVDTTKQIMQHYEYNYRASIESVLKNWKIIPDDSAHILAEAPVQVCAFLSGGDESTLKAVYGSMQNTIPVVLFKETGKLADIIIQCIEDTELGSKATYKRSISEGLIGTETFQLSPANIKQSMEYYWEQITHPELSVLMVQEILEKTYLFSICEAEGDDEHGELDYHLLSLIMNPSIKGNEKPDELNETLLSIAIALNRSDIARDKVFIEGVKWDDSKLVKHMNALLLSNKVQLIRVFIEKGFLLSNYLTAEILQLLYTQSIHTEHPGETLINVIRAFVKIPNHISLYLIGRALRELIGRQFDPTYIAPQFFLISTGAPKTQIFENPATDLFIWALLTERSELADYFWTQVQDPLPAALFAALLLRRLAMNATSLVTREAMFEYSRSFESKAYSLLTECHNDNQSLSFKTIVLERKLFGHMSCLMLAAEGRSMSFISHQCSEQYVERVWNGMIDPRSGIFPFVVALIIGIILPPLVPLSLKFQLKENDSSKLDTNKMSKMSPDKKISVDSKRQPHETSHSTKASLSLYFQKLKGFYVSPCVRFSYTTISYLAFLCFFTYVLLFTVDLLLPVISFQNLLLYIWVISFIAEHIFQGLFGEIPFKVYIAKLWKCLEIMAIIVFILGTALQLLVLTEETERLSFTPVNPVSAIQKSLLQLSRIFFGLSLCIFYHRILELFTVNIRLGPMVIMVQSMIVRDLIPFLALFTVMVTGFAILQWVTAYQSTASLNPITNLFTIFNALQLAYFQVFGEYEMEKLTGEVLLDSCKNNKINCPGGWSTWLSPILLGVYVILTQVLLLNLVIAMFASTYMRIEAASTKYWALQRYHIVGEYVDRSPLPPPLNLIWFIYLIILYLIRVCKRRSKKKNHPFKKSYEAGSPEELRLIHWEKLRFWDFDRYIIQGKKRKQKGAGKMVSVRTTVMQLNKGADISSEISTAIGTYYQTTYDFLTRVEAKTERLKIVEDKVDKITSLLKDLNLQKLQSAEAPTKQQTGMDASMDSRLERILTTREEPIKAYSRSKSTEQPLSRIIKTTKSGQLAVFERKSHKYAVFVPPTADRTPRLFPYPIPWDKQSQKPMCLGWKPPVYTIEGWSEPVKFSEISETRKQQFKTPGPNAPLPDPITGYPRNPGGRTGVSGKGNLPQWGANSAIIIVITRRSGEFSSGLNDRIKESFRVIAHKISLGSQLPWYLVQHPTHCNLKVCVQEVFCVATQNCMGRLTKLKPEKRAILEQTLDKFNRLPIKIIYSGYIDDTVNTDNAWIEPIVVHRHITDPGIDCDELLQLFAVEGAQVIWLDPEDKVGMRPSHEKILQKVEKRMQSYLDTSKTKKEVTFLEDV